MSDRRSFYLQRNKLETSFYKTVSFKAWVGKKTENVEIKEKHFKLF